MSHTINRSQLKLLSHREKTQTTNIYHIKYTLHLKKSSGEEVENRSSIGLFWTCLLLGGSVVKSEEAAAVKMRDCKRQKEAACVCIKK